MIAIVDYDAGNIRSVEKAVEALGQKAVVTRDSKEILRADKVILPGVGSFGDAMGKLNEYGLAGTIRECTGSGKPFLGICLGLQLLFEDSEETPGVKGLGILPGHILRIPESEGLKIPHMGWNSIDIREGCPLFAGLSDELYVYFVHSYYLHADNRDDVAAKTTYSVEIDASVAHDNIFACQFHPEKSGTVGLGILKNFIKM